MPSIRGVLRRAAVAASLAAAGTMAHAAGEFSCVAGESVDCALATSTVSWSWDGEDFTIANDGSGYVSEVYFDLGGGMSVSFLSGTGIVYFYAGASPSSLPGGSTVGFVSDASYDSDPAGITRNGIDQGETATFRILGAALDSFDADSLAGGVRVRSLVEGGASLVTTTIAAESSAVPEPGSLALVATGLIAAGWARRRRTG